VGSVTAERKTDFRELVDLASMRLGGSVLYATDDFFAEKENLLKPEKPVWKEHEYTERGKWMDGWESRRKRTPGHDYAIIRLGVPGIVEGFVVDTSFFRGNYPESCSVDALAAGIETTVETLLESQWSEIMPRSPLKGDSENIFTLDSSHAVTHLRFNIYPDGGVARLRVHGTVVPDWRRLGGLHNELDLASIEAGGEVLQCSDMFFGPKHNLIMPGRAHNMSDGWETRRRRGPGHDWVIVKLGAEGRLSRLEIDTSHFKGNYPDTASVEGRGDAGTRGHGEEWVEILPRTKMQADTRHVFVDQLQNRGPFTHVRLNVFPDGGVARLRVYGKATERARSEETVRRINTLDPSQLAEELRTTCGSQTWVDAMTRARPFSSWDDLSAKADRIASSLSREDWLEAFRCHPRIGDRGHGWAADEQAGVRDPSAFAKANQDYEKHFGHIYIAFATGKSGEEMLADLRNRMRNSPEEELRVASEEQRKITKLRLQKLVG
jgi:allantoicase